MSKCHECGAKAGFMMSLCDECIRKHETASLARVAAAPPEESIMPKASSTATGTSPWKSRPAGLVRFGRAAEAALSKDSGQPVSVDAFELGVIRASNRAMKIIGLLLLAPIWIPLLFVVILLLIVPSWIYFPYRTWREWDEARSLGVSSGQMILGIVIAISFGFVGGLVMTMVLIGKLIPLVNMVVVARVGNRVVLLYQQFPMFNFPQFRKIEYIDGSDLSLDPSSSAKKTVLSLRGREEPKDIVVRRVAAWATGSPQINEANLKLLLRQ